MVYTFSPSYNVDMIRNNRQTYIHVRTHARTPTQRATKHKTTLDQMLRRKKREEGGKSGGKMEICSFWGGKKTPKGEEKKTYAITSLPFYCIPLAKVAINLLHSDPLCFYYTPEVENVR